MATSEMVSALRSELKTVLEYNEVELINRSEWGEINFMTAKADIKDALSLSQDLIYMPLEHLTDRTIKEIHGSIPRVASSLTQINDFSITSGGSPSDNRDSLCSQLHEAVDNFRDYTSSQIPYLMYMRGDVGENIDKLQQKISQGQDLYNEANTWIEDKKAEIEKIGIVARLAAASAGVGIFTDEFDREAERLQARSKHWLYSTSGLAVATVVVAFLSYFWPSVSSDAGISETLRNLVSKAAVVVVLFTGAVWCGRIYRALVHQATVNRHRALSLKTFQAFVEATDDKYVKDAILMAATNSVFSNVPTGLVEERKNHDSGVNFVEFGRSATEKTVEQTQQS